MQWWRRKQRDEELARELQCDLELEEEEQRERGVVFEEWNLAIEAPCGPGTGWSDWCAI